MEVRNDGRADPKGERDIASRDMAIEISRGSTLE